MVKSKQNEFLYTALMGVFLLTSYTSIYGLKTRNIIHPSSINGLILSSYVGFITCTAAIITLSIYNVYKATNHKNYNITPKKAAHHNNLQTVQKSDCMESTPSTDSDFLDENDLIIGNDLIQLSESTSDINSPTSPVHEETSNASHTNSKIENTNKGMLLNLTSPLTPTVLTPFSTYHKPLSSDLKVKEVKVGNKVREDLDNLIPSDLINGISSTTSNQPQCVPVPPPMPKRPLLDLTSEMKEDKMVKKSDQSPNTAVAVLPPALSFSDHEEHSNISQQQSKHKPGNSDSKVEDVKEDIKLGLISPPIPVQLQNIDNAQDVFIAPPPPPMPIEPSSTLENKKSKKGWFKKKYDKFKSSKKTKEDSSATILISPSIFEEPLSIPQQPSESKLDNSDSKVKNIKEDRQLDLMDFLTPVQSQNIDNAQGVFIPPAPSMPEEPSNISQQSSEFKPCDQSRTALLDAIRNFKPENLKKLKEGLHSDNQLSIKDTLFEKIKQRRKGINGENNTELSNPDSKGINDDYEKSWG